MQFDVKTALGNLRCQSTTDPSGWDEPYAWIFFAKIDGTTIRQRDGDPNRLSGNITLQAGSGRPGNLGESSVTFGASIAIPASIGEFSTALRPIEIKLFGATKIIRVFAPGTVLVVMLLLEEDSAPRDATLAASEAVRTFVEQRLNDFVNELNLSPIILAAIASPDPAAGAIAAFFNLFGDFRSTLAAEATQFAIDKAMEVALDSADLWNPVDLISLGVAALDPDEVVGTATFLVTERNLIDANLNVFQAATLTQSMTSPTAVYSVPCLVNGALKFFPGDVRTYLLEPPARRKVKGPPLSGHGAVLALAELGTHVIQKGRRCLEAGTEIEVKRVGYKERHAACVQYPFLAYRYYLDNVELLGDTEYANEPGEVALPKIVAFPEFDEDMFYLVGGRTESRDVTISFEKIPDPLAPQLTQLVITNDPEDGCFDLELRIEGVLPNGTAIPVATEVISVVGQTIELGDGVLESYIACVAQYLKSRALKVKLQVPAQWLTPEVRWQRLETLNQRLEALRETRQVSEAVLERARIQLARKSGF